MKILTVVARHPDGDRTGDYSGDAVDPHDDFDAETKATVEKLRRRRDPVRHLFMRAGSVSALANLLRKHGAGVELIQIVGHARVGELWLGATWTRTMGTGHLSYILDSSPDTYRNLRDVVPEGATVRLIGCMVGASSDDRFPTVADGVTLVFDLARMWLRPHQAPRTVCATVDSVTDADFDDDGVLASSVRVVACDGLRVVEPSAPATTHANGGDLVELRVAAAETQPANARWTAPPAVAMWRRWHRGNVLAAPEAYVKVQLPDGEHDGELVALGRILRVRRGARGVEYYALER
ncbi:MAG: hypothetical protein KIT31_07445 [Deltaproteobacteria bacterium]|nr:hypothetical protein [Deltaproteobacteria bacterium]